MAQPKKSSSKAHTIDFDSHDARRHLDQLKNYLEAVQKNLMLNGNQLEASLNTLTAVKRFADAFLKLEMKSALTDPLMTLAVELKHISMGRLPGALFQAPEGDRDGGRPPEPLSTSFIHATGAICLEMMKTAGVALDEGASWIAHKMHVKKIYAPGADSRRSPQVTGDHIKRWRYEIKKEIARRGDPRLSPSARSKSPTLNLDVARYITLVNSLRLGGVIVLEERWLRADVRATSRSRVEKQVNLLLTSLRSFLAKNFK